MYRTLNPSEQNYAPQNSQLLAILKAVIVRIFYLYGRKLIFQKYHALLWYIQTQERQSSFQVRWLEKLLVFNVNFLQVKRQFNVVADTLRSQRINMPIEEYYSKQLISRLLKEKFQVNNVSTLILENPLKKILENEYNSNPEFTSMFYEPRETFKVKNSLLYFGLNILRPKGRFQNIFYSRISKY